jgi:glycosyltransferase involved in cell wall biosynthesis
MRVLWLTSAFHPQTGGVITYVDRLTGSLVSQGHAVGLVTTGLQMPPAAGIAHFPIPFVDGPTREQVPGVQQAIRAAVAAFRPDTVHLSSAGLAVYVDALPRGIPIVATVHGNDLTKPWQGWPSGDTGAAIVAGLHRCAEIFCVSRHTRSLVVAKGSTCRRRSSTMAAIPRPSLRSGSIAPRSCGDTASTPNGPSY